MQSLLSYVWCGYCGQIIPNQFLIGVNIPFIHVTEVFQDTINVLVVDFLTTEQIWNCCAKSTRKVTTYYFIGSTLWWHPRRPRIKKKGCRDQMLHQSLRVQNPLSVDFARNNYHSQNGTKKVPFVERVDFRRRQG